MKALILAAGLGTRLLPLTENTPKPLLNIQGIPHLSYVLKYVQNFGVSEFVINTHYLSEQVESFCKFYEQENPGISITITHEELLLGSAGTLRKCAGLFSDDENILIVYADVLTSADLKEMNIAHVESGASVTILCTEENDISGKGVIECDSSGIVTAFYEKPPHGVTESKYVNSGIYIIRADVLPIIQEMNAPTLDFGHDVFPNFLSRGIRMGIYKTDGYVLDIGSHANYKIAQTLDLK